MNQRCDFLIVGSGLPGSVLALLLKRLGYDVRVVDRQRHPRFTIGESSTPTADFYLARIAQEFGIPELLPLARYQATRQSYPGLAVGPKRGFSYFHHDRGVEFDPGPDNRNQMLVAASSSVENSDSNWLRSEVDALVVSWFDRYEIPLLQDSTAEIGEFHGDHWKVRVRSPDEQFELEAGYLIDASGRAGAVIRQMGGQSVADELHTFTSALYGHYHGVEPWTEFMDLSAQRDHPYRADHAAVHHHLGDGWLWQLGFDNGVTSCGIVVRGDSSWNRELKRLAGQPPAFHELLNGFPTLSRQMKVAELVAPENGPIYLARVQHLFDRVAGKGWCALPGTIGFVDPLHSKGLAHAFSGIYRLGKRFEEFRDSFGGQRMNQSVLQLANQFRFEVLFLDRLISLAYSSLHDFSGFCLAAFWYFVAAIRMERDFLKPGKLDVPFLLSAHDRFRDRLYEWESHVRRTPKAGMTEREFQETTKSLLAEFDPVGLFSPAVTNMYPQTAAPDRPE